MSDPSASAAPSRGPMPVPVVILAAGFFFGMFEHSGLAAREP